MNAERATTQARESVVLGVTDPASAVLLTGFPAHLAAEGWQVHVVAGGVLPRPEAGVDHHVVPMRRDPRPVEDLVALIRMTRLLRRLRPRLVSFGTPKAGLLGVVGSRLAGVPVRVYLARGLRAETMTGWPQRLALGLDRFAMSCATVVVAVSPSLRDQIVGRRLSPPGKVVVIGQGSSNGVDTHRFRPATPAERRTARAALALDDSEFVVGFVGRISVDKGLETLVKAAARMTGRPTLILVGDPEPPAFVDHLREMAERLHVTMRVVAPTSELERIYAAIDALCLPSRREGFPNVVLEASASGVPVVVSSATGCVDAVAPEHTGLVFDTDDDVALARCLDRLASSPDLRVAMGRAGREWVKARFDRSAVWRELTDFFNRLMGEPAEVGAV